MEDGEGKQLLISVESGNAIDDDVCNDADLATNDLRENNVSVEATGIANEMVGTVVEPSVNVASTVDDQSCKRVGNDDQSDSSNIANTAKVASQLRKRTTVREQVATVAAETPVKRRRVQHNYRRLSSAGYVDDYDGKERFSGKKTTSTAGNSMTLKSKIASSLPGRVAPQRCTSKVTQPQPPKTVTTAIKGWCVFA